MKHVLDILDELIEATPVAQTLNAQLWVSLDLYEKLHALNMHDIPYRGFRIMTSKLMEMDTAVIANGLWEGDSW